jgi:hypothetical protein
MYHLEAPTSHREKDKTAKYIYLMGFVMFAGLIHLMQWNQHAGSIIPLKLKQIMNTATSDELYKIGQICGERFKWDCRRTALWQSYLKDTKNEKAAIELGQDFVERRLYMDALRVYTIYFKNQGHNIEARYRMAISLSELARFKEARVHFQYLLKHNKDKVSQPGYVRTYVHYLIKNREYAAAKVLITQTRKNIKNASYFLEKEMQQIESKLKTST